MNVFVFFRFRAISKGIKALLASNAFRTAKNGRELETTLNRHPVLKEFRDV